LFIDSSFVVYAGSIVLNVKCTFAGFGVCQKNHAEIPKSIVKTVYNGVFIVVNKGTSESYIDFVKRVAFSYCERPGLKFIFLLPT